MTPPTRAPTPTPADNSARRWTLAEKGLTVLAALLTVGSGYLGLQTAAIAHAKDKAQAAVETKTGDLAGLQGQFDQLQNQYNQLKDENTKLKSQLGLPPGPTGNQSSQQYLSELDQVDYDKNSGTGTSDNGAQTINQVQYGHSITMNAGCQNDDGGDFWVDYSIAGSWQRLRATIGVSDSSSTQSKATFKVLDAVSGRELASGPVSAGTPLKINASIADIVRVRLFINDPNSPNQACGFEKIETAVVWGDALLARQ